MRSSYILLFAFSNHLNMMFSQEAKILYRPEFLFADENSFYVSGTRSVHAFKENLDADGYFHTHDFYLSRFGIDGRKRWETVLKNKRDFDLSSELFKNGNYLYTLCAVKNRKPNSSVFYITHFLVKFDTLGNVVHEKQLIDSTFYPFNNVIYTSSFIYVVLNRYEGITCEKYDYNFALIDKSRNEQVIALFYDSKVFTTAKNYLCVGAFNNVDYINKQVQSKNLAFYKPLGDCLKKAPVNSNDEYKTTINQISTNETVENAFFDNGILYYVTTDVQSPGKKFRLYSYDEELGRIKLLTDTLTRSFYYFKGLKKDEFLFVTLPLNVRDDKTSAWTRYPSSLYYFKNGKILTRLELEEIKQEDCRNFFEVVDRRLFIYQIVNPNTEVRVRILDYETGIFLK